MPEVSASRWVRIPVDMDTLVAEVIDGVGHPLSPLTETTGTIGGAKAPGAPATHTRRRYYPMCAYGYMGLWICAVCLKIGRDFRRDFCGFGVGV